MKINKENKKIISKLNHIEIVHDNPQAAAEFMAEAFGAVQVEKEFSENMGKAFGFEMIHMMFGGVVYQILKPNDVLAEWKERLKNEGPSINNLSFQVHGTQALRQKLKDMGCKELHDWGGMTTDGLGFSCPDGTSLAAYVVDAREQCGLFFEFMEDLPEWEPGEIR